MADVNSSRRATILGKVRAALEVSGNDRGREIIVQKRLRGRSNNLIPSRAKMPKAAQRSLFQTMLEGSRPRLRILQILSNCRKLWRLIWRRAMSARLCAAVTIPVFDGLDWENALIERTRGAAVGGDDVSLSHAIAGAAETGTLFLVSGKNNPTTLNYLPETHIIVVEGRHIYGSYEEAWGRIRLIRDVDRRAARCRGRSI